ncbi:hypothetical protein [Aeromonas sp. MrichA-1]|uniref:hypothetical protein n=1 Tax=Aeromonas sp. MrichA-1 TaxID=2823362 RepID=UPI001B33979A|nr:hypothetical protein [Aeromonas sp. MrichA-1]MBP4081269.1 hypothetical protein [Aeromonas sp. MrichA-1]
MCQCENKEECKIEKNKKERKSIPIIIFEVIVIFVVFFGGLHYLSDSGKRLVNNREIIRDNIKKEIVIWSRSQPDGTPTGSIIINYYQCQKLYELNHAECLEIMESKSFKSAVKDAILKSDVPVQFKDKFLNTNKK